MIFPEFVTACTEKAIREGIAAGEVVVPANVSFAAVAAITSASLIPVVVDIRPGLYVLDERVGAAMVGSTVGIMAPWTFGNAPDLTSIRRHAAAHDEALIWSPAREGSAVNVERFWELYEVCAPHARWVTGPEQIEGTQPAWDVFPLVVNDPDKRMGLLMALQECGATIMTANVTEDPRMAEMGTWGKIGDLPGANAAQRGGLVLPLTADPATVGRVLGEAAP
jgi:dTDP-4-amino-4,6-dideoxygalactose transaminase